MCSHNIRGVRIRRIVIGAWTPDVGGVSSAYPILGAADIPIWVSPLIVWDVLVEECGALRNTRAGACYRYPVSQGTA